MATNSIRSDALEPSRAEARECIAPDSRLIRLLPVYGLPILTILLIALFSIILPDTFPTMLNLRSIIADKAIIALLSLAAMIPMASGKIDLTVGTASCCGTSSPSASNPCTACRGPSQLCSFCPRRPGRFESMESWLRSPSSTPSSRPSALAPRYTPLRSGIPGAAGFGQPSERIFSR